MSLKKLVFLALVSTTILACTKHSLENVDKWLHVPKSRSHQLMDSYMGNTHAGNIEPTFHPLKIHTIVDDLASLKSRDLKMYNFMVNKLIPSVTQHIEKSYNVREV